MLPYLVGIRRNLRSALPAESCSLLFRCENGNDVQTKEAAAETAASSNFVPN